MAGDCLKYFIYIGVQPLGSLGETANVLGDVLSVSFVKDECWRYDEYPAFIAGEKCLNYSLLGTPLPEDDLAQERSEDFQLIVEVDGGFHQKSKSQVSKDLVDLVVCDGRIVCWLLD
ncbi:hypothetical protein [Pseudomonas carassii]|uniref:DUF559 domain-containing protein n=1 Tax=Pseudomonas carassii TaxID=3115855 RepID=A0ABU7HF04_9PSED|nr:hypothetical protein [Pseudomonas sp. 137P]MEE1889553.1 hypothetical protein [Pseudomonas sp. 137P]